MSDDAQLIDAALEGDTAAFGQLVRKYQDRLYNTIVHSLGSDEAEDVVQDAFVQAYVKLDTFQRTSSFYTWLYRIAFNAAVSRRRKKKPASSVENYRPGSLELQDRKDAPDEQMLRAERVGQVQAALAALSEEHRTILVLREMEGCCYETIADILGLSVGTVRSRLHRARMQMREQLKHVLQSQPID